MANVDKPFGLRPYRQGRAAPFSGMVRPYYVPSSYGTALFVGDAVTKTGTSNTAEVVYPAAGSWGIGELAEVNKTAAGDGNAITGVIVGFAVNPDNLNRIYKPASTEAIVYVMDDPSAEFEIQADGSIAATDIGLNAVLIDTHSGDTATGMSGTELDTTSDAPAADASNQLTILGIIPRVGNDQASANVQVRVRINNHTEAHASLGI